MKYAIISSFLLSVGQLWAQKETVLSTELTKAVMFFTGAQLEHNAKGQLKPGRQTVVLEKLTDYIDPGSIQVKAKGAVTILSVGMRKNYEDKRISNEEIKELSAKIRELEKREKALRDEQAILQVDRQILNQNSSIGGQQQGVKVAELKEAYSFIHLRMSEISKREAEILESLERIVKDKNKYDQELDVQRSKPVTNYSEVLVELDVLQNTAAQFELSYLTSMAGWDPYYDIRSKGIGSTIAIEAKARVRQQTGLDWNEIDLVLSTNDPYQNANERELLPWYLDYNTFPDIAGVAPSAGQLSFDYAGQKIRGEVIDAATGESMPFAKVSIGENSLISTISDGMGKFELTVPVGARTIIAQYKGYQQVTHAVNAPYLKFFMIPNGVNFETFQWAMPVSIVDFEEVSYGEDDKAYSYSSQDSFTYENSEMYSKKGALKPSRRGDASAKMDFKAEYQQASELSVVEIKRDLRVEYQIQSKFTVPCNGIDQRVSIANYDLPATYEYHSVPKIDPSVYLVSQISGWEKLNLLNGESNIYFDGTYIGKSYVDAQSTRDTLTFSMGKDSKIQVERKRLAEKSSNRSIGSRQKYEISWEIKVRNNGGADIPLILKDQFPVSTNSDIKVKRGELNEASADENSGIITWNLKLSKNQSKIIGFNYQVEYSKGQVIYLE